MAEVKALDGIQHPNVIRFYEHFECALGSRSTADVASEEDALLVVRDRQRRRSVRIRRHLTR